VSILNVDQYEGCFVKSFGWYENEDCLYIAMEYLPSGELYKCLSDRSKLPEQEAQDITFQILEAISFMHVNDFAHRDLKPQVVPSSQNFWGPVTNPGTEHTREEKSA
jgi:serine/threonine protein kinase